MVFGLGEEMKKTDNLEKKYSYETQQLKSSSCLLEQEIYTSANFAITLISSIAQTGIASNCISTLRVCTAVMVVIFAFINIWRK